MYEVNGPKKFPRLMCSYVACSLDTAGDIIADYKDLVYPNKAFAVVLHSEIHMVSTGIDTHFSRKSVWRFLYHNVSQLYHNIM